MIVERKDKTANFGTLRANIDKINWGHPATTPVPGKRTKKVYGNLQANSKSNITLLGIPKRSEPTVIHQDLLADWMKDND
jgi:hypothetical protein